MLHEARSPIRICAIRNKRTHLLSPHNVYTYEGENRTKPQIVKDMESTDYGLTADQAALASYKGAFPSYRFFCSLTWIIFLGQPVTQHDTGSPTFNSKLRTSTDPLVKSLFRHRHSCTWPCNRGSQGPLFIAYWISATRTPTASPLGSIKVSLNRKAALAVYVTLIHVTA